MERPTDATLTNSRPGSKTDWIDSQMEFWQAKANENKTNRVTSPMELIVPYTQMLSLAHMKAQILVDQARDTKNPANNEY